MKLIHKMLFVAFLVFSLGATILYTACNKNKCSNVKCLNQGACDGGRCVCPRGFEGNRCQTLSRDKFIFTYNGGDSCMGTPFDNHYTQYPVQLVAVLHDSVEMMLKNLLNDPADSAVCTIQSTDSFTFIGANNATTFTGVGKMRNDSLWLKYHVIQGIENFDCAYFGQSLR